MKLTIIFMAISALTLQGCALLPSGKELDLQVYICSPGNNFDVANALVGHIEEDSLVISGSPRKVEQKTSSDQELFEISFLADNAHWRKLAIDQTGERNSLLVYDIDIPKYVSELDWSEWKRPNYIQQGKFAFFMVMEKSTEGVYSPQPDDPKVMYRVIDSYLYRDYRYGRESEPSRVIPPL